MKLILANPRGFCAGVDRAIEIVERALAKYGPPIYVRHEIVHNRFVVEGLREKGAIFVDELDEVPDNATVIFSAHGVPRSVQIEAKRRDLTVFDATCPLVKKVHMEVRKFAEKCCDVILIGHPGHPEVVGTMGQFNGFKDSDCNASITCIESAQQVSSVNAKDPDNLSYVTQTTLSIDDSIEIIKALKNRFPNIKGPNQKDICYATQNRQDAVKTLANQCDVVFVVGSKNSSNSNRLREIAEGLNAPAHLIDDASEIEGHWLEDKHTIGLTAGASAPEILVKGVVDYFIEKGAVLEEMNGRCEKVAFSIPDELE